MQESYTPHHLYSASITILYQCGVLFCTFRALDAMSILPTAAGSWLGRCSLHRQEGWSDTYPALLPCMDV